MARGSHARARALPFAPLCVACSPPVPLEPSMYLSDKASRARQREAQNARNNRKEIGRALTLGQITRRDLYKWGLLTAGGFLALKNGLSPLARSAFAAVPTGTPLSPLFGARK